MKKWNLWIDDIRDPREHSSDWKDKKYIWAQSVNQAIYFCILFQGPPQFMSLDHDLGYDPVTGRSPIVPEFLRWLSDQYPNECPDYRCHTANPQGKLSMESFMDSWKRSLHL